MHSPQRFNVKIHVGATHSIARLTFCFCYDREIPLAQADTTRHDDGASETRMFIGIVMPNQNFDTAELVKSIPLFSGLGKRDRSALAKTSRLRRPLAYTKLVKQGEAEVRRNSELVAESSPLASRFVREQLCTRLRVLDTSVFG